MFKKFFDFKAQKNLNEAIFLLIIYSIILFLLISIMGLLGYILGGIITSLDVNSLEILQNVKERTIDENSEIWCNNFIVTTGYIFSISISSLFIVKKKLLNIKTALLFFLCPILITYVNGFIGLIPIAILSMLPNKNLDN